jgi:hypothetical protein
MSKIKDLTHVTRFSLDLFPDRSGIAAHKPSNRLAQTPRSARRCDDREQEVVEFNSKSACAAEQNQKQESLVVKV